MSDKITKVLQTFSPDWQRKLDAYLKCAYFQVSDTVQNMLNYYLELIIKSNIKKLTDESLSNHLFPNMEFDSAKIHRLKSESLEVLKAFIIQQRVNMDSTYNVDLLLTYYLENNLNSIFTFTYKQIVKKNENTPINIKTSFYDDLSLKHTFVAFLSSNNPIKNTKSILEYNNNIAEIDEKVDVFYYIQKLENACRILNMYKINEIQNVSEDVQNLLQTLEKKEFIREHPIIKIYYYICKLMIDPNQTTYYDQLVVLLGHFQEYITLTDIQAIYSHLQNYCTRQINGGVKGFDLKLFTINEEMIRSKKIYDYTGKLSPDKYRAILAIAIRLNKFDWLATFIEEQKPYLREEHRESLTQYGLALIAFKQKDYGKVLKCVNQMNHVDAIFDLRSKVMQLQSYYELGDTTLESQSETFRLFLIRQKMTASNKIVAYKNFNKLIMNLYLLDFPTEEKLDKLKSKIEKTSPLAEKKWLIEKVEEKQTRI